MSYPARLVAVIGVVATTLVGVPALAQEGGRERDILTLASKTPWVGRAGDLVLRVHADANAPGETELAVAVHGRLTSRSQFERTLDGSLRGSPIMVLSEPLDRLGRDPAGALSVRLPVQDPALPRDPARMLLSRDGVYPVRVELRERGGGEVLTGFTTHLVYVAGVAADRDPLGVAVILPFHSPPTTTADGTRVLPDLDPLRDLATAVAAHRSVPLTVDPTPETVEALSESPDGEGGEVLAELKSSLTGRQLVSSTYVETDPRSFLEAGLRDELTAQRARARQVLRETLDVRADPRTWVLDGGLDPELLDLARVGQVDRLVVSEAALQPTDRPVTLAQPFALESRRNAPSVSALAADPGLSAHFSTVADRDGGPVLAAHHFLADLAVIHFDSPGTARAAVALPPRDWRADASFLEALLSGLAQSPVVEPVTLDQAFAVPEAEGNRGARLVRRPSAEAAAADLPGRTIREARERLESFASLVDPGNAVEHRLDRALLSSQATGLPAARRRALIDSVSRGIDAEFSQLSLPGNRSITLTARTGEIPITIQSELDYPVRARLRVESDKLSFPDGSRREIELSNTNTTERFSVRARTSGAFPVRVILESPEGDLVLGRSLFTVRSTAASGVGVALSAGAVGFLGVWWAGHVVQARRRKGEAGPTGADG